MKIHLFFIAIALLLATACGDDDVLNLDANSSDTLIFGIAYGFCAGDECVRLFKLEDEELYKTNFERLVAGEPIDFDDTPLSEADYELANPLRRQIPDALLTTRDTILGIPDAYDQGTIYIEVENENESRYWLLDTNVEALPVNIQPYAEQVTDVWRQLIEQ